MPSDQFKKLYWFFADTPNITKNYRDIWKKINDGEPILIVSMFQLSVWCEKCDAARHRAIIGKQLLISNDKNRIRWAILGQSQDGVSTDVFENFSMKSLKRDQSNDTKLNPIFSHWSIPLRLRIQLGQTDQNGPKKEEKMKNFHAWEARWRLLLETECPFKGVQKSGPWYNFLLDCVGE